MQQDDESYTNSSKYAGEYHWCVSQVTDTIDSFDQTFLTLCSNSTV